MLKKLGLGFLALALVVGVGASSASATLTLSDLAIASSGALTLAGNMVFTPGTHPTRDTFIIGVAGNNATLRVFSDNLTALAIQGLNSSAAAVNGFAGVFYHTDYDVDGTVDTRFVVGSGVAGAAGLDLDLSSPNAILVRATDPATIGTAYAGVVKVMSLTGIEFHARATSDNLSPNRLIVDRVTQSTTLGANGIGNTSDVNLNVNTGNLRLLAANTTGAVSVNTLTSTERDALTKVVGMIIWNSTTSSFQGWDGSAWDELSN